MLPFKREGARTGEWPLVGENNTRGRVCKKEGLGFAMAMNWILSAMWQYLEADSSPKLPDKNLALTS